jgi:hypothetical protein
MIIKLKDASQNKSFIMLCDSLDVEPVNRNNLFLTK